MHDEQFPENVPKGCGQIAITGKRVTGRASLWINSVIVQPPLEMHVSPPTAPPYPTTGSGHVWMQLVAERVADERASVRVHLGG